MGPSKSSNKLESCLTSCFLAKLLFWTLFKKHVKKTHHEKNDTSKFACEVVDKQEGQQPFLSKGIKKFRRIGFYVQYI
jgi:hypothetical protein